MKPFDLKAALEGAPLITRDGKHKNLTIYEVDLKSKFPLKIKYVPDITRYCSLDGKLYPFHNIEDKYDLFMQEDSDLVEEVEENKNNLNKEAADFIEGIIFHLNERLKTLRSGA